MKKKKIIIIITLLFIICISVAIWLSLINNEQDSIDTAKISDKKSENIINNTNEISYNNQFNENNTINNEDKQEKEEKQEDKKEKKTENIKTNNNKAKSNNQPSSTKVEEKKKTSNNDKVNNSKIEDDKQNNTDDTGKEKEDEKEKQEEEVNKDLANKHFTKYNAEKTAHAVSYLNSLMKSQSDYNEFGGYAIAVTSKPTNVWFSYSGDYKLDGLALTGCLVKVYIVDEYRYNNRGTSYYLYDTKAYVHQEVLK